MTIRRFSRPLPWLGAIALLAPAPAVAQMDHSMHIPAPAANAPAAPAQAPVAPAKPMATPMGGMEHGDHDGMDMSGAYRLSHLAAHSSHNSNIARWSDNAWCCEVIDAGDDPIMIDGVKFAAFAEGSGTARLPGREAGMPGLHTLAGDWMLMAHGAVSVQYTDHSGPRGDAKLYAPSMLMMMAERDGSWGRFQGRAMFSLDPAMRHTGYPSLFATGEVAYGRPLVDRQHPHDLFMELAARLDIDLGEQASLFVYGGPVGEPALGPSAFMHRRSAAYNPEAPITHHWFDSTHITYGVVTAGIAAPRWQLEASAFRGQEPDEFRWNIESPRLDSWSIRGTFSPSPSWTLQASYGRLEQPEPQHPGEDEKRLTLSAHYSDDALSGMLAFSAKDRVPGSTLTAWLGEANWNLSEHHTLFGRIENVANDELFPDPAGPLHDGAFRVTKFQAGYAYRLPLGPFGLAVGGAFAAYAKPSMLDPYYGRHPVGYTAFAKLTLGNPDD